MNTTSTKTADNGKLIMTDLCLFAFICGKKRGERSGKKKRQKNDSYNFIVG